MSWSADGSKFVAWHPPTNAMLYDVKENKVMCQWVAAEFSLLVVSNDGQRAVREPLPLEATATSTSST